MPAPVQEPSSQSSAPSGRLVIPHETEPRGWPLALSWVIRNARQSFGNRSCGLSRNTKIVPGSQFALVE